MGLFTHAKPKNATEFVHACVEECAHLEDATRGEEKRAKAIRHLSEYLEHLKTMLTGDGTTNPDPADVAAIAAKAVEEDFPLHVVKHLADLEFEARKDAVQVVAKMMRAEVDGACPVAEWMAGKIPLVRDILKGYQKPDVALNLGCIARELNRSEKLSALILECPEFWYFFTYVNDSNFEIASDAFASLKEFLTRHKALVAPLLANKYDEFFGHYQKLLTSDNYITRRQSLKLLGELLLDRANTQAMMHFITTPENLIQMMTLLKDSSKSIQFEAFHVFKVRVRVYG
mmetsp:Transcript_48844/g.156460  ORF Transcript_48844/g.156460 Transcript_48844/m.156460 type:complete len:287 (+) Transcript_48844:262-1122(+)